MAGGGAAEISIARGLKEYADTISGREGLEPEHLQRHFKVVPKTLAENAGLDSIDSLVDLRAAHEKSLYMGDLYVFKGEVRDMYKAGVIEPHRELKNKQSSPQLKELK